MKPKTFIIAASLAFTGLSSSNAQKDLIFEGNNKIVPDFYFHPEVLKARETGFKVDIFRTGFAKDKFDCSDEYIHRIVDNHYVPGMKNAATRAELDEHNWAAQEHSKLFNSCHQEGAHWMRKRCNEVWNDNLSRFPTNNCQPLCKCQPLSWACWYDPSAPGYQSCGWVDPCTGKSINGTGVIGIGF